MMGTEISNEALILVKLLACCDTVYRRVGGIRNNAGASAARYDWLVTYRALSGGTEENRNVIIDLSARCADLFDKDPRVGVACETIRDLLRGVK